MKVAAAMFADFEQDFWGRPSALHHDLAGRTVVERALQRFAAIENASDRLLVVQPRDLTAAQLALSRLRDAERVRVAAWDDGVRPRRRMYRSARKWNMESWRGGLLGATWFDEFIEPALVARILNETRADALFCLDAQQALLDPTLCDGIIAHAVARQPDATFGFTNSPPGLAGLLLTRTETARLLQLEIPVGLLFSYRPELVRGDVLTHASCCQIEPQIAHCAARFVPDTLAGRKLMCAALRELGENVAADRLCSWAGQNALNLRSAELPVEVELELTTEYPLPKTRLRPVSATPARNLLELSTVRRLARELGDADDRLIILGGHGDPLQHPALGEILRELRSHGVFGICVRTPLVQPSTAAIDALFEHDVDVLQVELNAHSRETYQSVTGADAFDQVRSALNDIGARRKAESRPQPLVACSLTRCQATAAEIEGFFDDWIRATGSALIEGYSEFAGLLPTDSLLPTLPLVREPCRRVRNRLVLLADGAVSSCDQDVRAQQCLGSWFDQSLQEIWAGAARERFLASQSALSLTSLPVCQSCSAWHRY